MTDKQLVKETADFVKAKFSGEGSGHDWWHIYRVWQLSRHIAEKEKGANKTVVELSALLHDIADWKFHDEKGAGGKAAREWLEKLALSQDVIGKIEYIVENVSFKGGKGKKMQSLEGKIVQDADRLEGIGAIGIARAFAFGGHLGRPIYDPENKPKQYKNFADFKKQMKDGTTINHFYEKLLLLKDLMNTETGKQMAIKRHKYVEDYLKEFYAEWDGEL